MHSPDETRTTWRPAPEPTPETLGMGEGRGWALVAASADLGGWEGAAVREDLGMCFAVAGLAERRRNQPPPMAQRGAA